MGSDLLQNPIINLFGWPSLHNAEEGIFRDTSIVVAAGGVAAELLLVFPNDTLRRHVPVISVDTGHGEGSPRLPAIQGSQHDPAPGSLRQLVEILAVVRLLGIIAIV